jgi:tripartite-type tricarboxylate transporter receptor subunit TctC
LSRAFSDSLEGTSWFAVYAPAKTPAATIQQINAAFNKALAAPDLRERFLKLGLEPTGGSAADLQAIM